MKTIYFSGVIFLVCALLISTAVAGEFAVITPEEGVYKITYNGEELINSVYADVSNSRAEDKRQYSHTVLPDGSEVYNVWSEEPDRRFRMEIALLENKSVIEMTFMSETRAFAPMLKESKL